MPLTCEQPGGFCAGSEPVQPELFDPGQLPVGMELLLPAEVQRHRFTAEIVSRNQAKYQSIVAGLAEGLGVRQMARAFGVSHHTVQTIREREACLVATQKEQFGKRLFNVASMALEKLEECLERDLIPAGQMAVTTGILVDKSIAWSGQNIPRAEIRLGLSVESVKGLFAKLVEGSDVTLTTSQPGLGSEPVGILGLGASESVSVEKEGKPQ